MRIISTHPPTLPTRPYHHFPYISIWTKERLEIIQSIINLHSWILCVCVRVRRAFVQKKRKGNKLLNGSKKAIFEYDEEKKCLTYVKLPTENIHTHTSEIKSLLFYWIFLTFHLSFFFICESFYFFLPQRVYKSKGKKMFFRSTSYSISSFFLHVRGCDTRVVIGVNIKPELSSCVGEKEAFLY